MTTLDTRPGGSLAERRVPFSERVDIKFQLFREFVSEISANLSMGGMFLETQRLREPGSQFEFAIRLGDDFALIEGTGEVAWCRAEDAGPQRPAGMGVRFLSLSEGSDKLIRRVVEEHAKSGGQPFDLSQEASEEAGAARGESRPAPPPARLAVPTEVGPPPAARPPLGSPAPPPAVETPAAEAPPAERPAVPASPSAPEPAAPAAAPIASSAARAARRGGSVRRRGWLASASRLGGLALVSAAVGGLAVWMGHVILVQPQLDALARQVDELSHEAATRAAAARPPRPAEPPAAGGPLPAGPIATPRALPDDARLPDGEAQRREALQAVRAWAGAWSEKRIDDYLASYSAEFRPPGGLSRAAWEAQRRSRILRPGPISVSVAAMRAERLSDSQTVVYCTQAYRSAHYSDVVRKAIVLAREEGAWRIVEERVER